MSNAKINLSRKEAAEALGIGMSKLWSLTVSGEIPHIKVGRRVLYPIAELERWVRKQIKGGQR